jgi:hypothetical protein
MRTNNNSNDETVIVKYDNSIQFSMIIIIIIQSISLLAWQQPNMASYIQAKFNSIIQFNSLLLLVCCINSQKANYRCSTREDKIINITK